ncbi:hypothetical protein MAR_036281 [Mya arenaria]|uniref:Uncharacterized protein n=1 Tax=Mya arenaria TaxID=6604 RepID=A0ABY7EMZ0_MYAAR|nr:hypothetical protein MAR_036281 [Mya arenaria]
MKYLKTQKKNDLSAIYHSKKEMKRGATSGHCNLEIRDEVTEMSIQIESVTGGLDTVHVNGQLVHCNNATMALANITVEVKTDGSKEAETDGRKKAEFAGSIEAKTDNSDWLILLVAVPILIALGWISKLRFCGKQELDRQNLPDAA